ncbi:MAG: HAMP domain-containing sensor histidine kinase, partial [Minisyncoccia bacterium]
EDNFSITTKGRETELPIGFSVSALDGSFAGVVIIIRDVTADRELDEAKSGFISVASHQLRTPLTSIRWYSEMLLAEDTGPLNESQKDFMREIHGGAERLYQTVDLLLGISRVESGKMKSEKIAINLGEFTEGITKELRSQMNVKNLVLSVVPPPGDGVIVTLDPITLRQVVLNLVSNAIRYTNAQGFVEIKWWWGDDGKEIIYMVHDNGIGIPDSEHSHMFSKFFRAENARAQVPDGSGLGLALVKDLVESWGGKIWYDSREGSHTTFFFTIPR